MHCHDDNLNTKLAAPRGKERQNLNGTSTKVKEGKLSQITKKTVNRSKAQILYGVSPHTPWRLMITRKRTRAHKLLTTINSIHKKRPSDTHTNTNPITGNIRYHTPKNSSKY